jgi:hybrid cluster-associated redox disulfide protein
MQCELRCDRTSLNDDFLDFPAVDHLAASTPLFVQAQRTGRQSGIVIGFGAGAVKMKPIISNDMLMDKVMRSWPATIRVILNYHMYCVGCPVAQFQTVSDACREHHIDEAAFLRDLRLAIET